MNTMQTDRLNQRTWAPLPYHILTGPGQRSPLVSAPAGAPGLYVNVGDRFDKLGCAAPVSRGRNRSLQWLPLRRAMAHGQATQAIAFYERVQRVEGWAIPTTTGIDFIRFLGGVGRCDLAQRVFDQLIAGAGAATVDLYNVVIDAYVRNNLLAAAQACLIDMTCRGVRGTRTTYAFLFDRLVQQADATGLILCHQQMTASRIPLDADHLQKLCFAMRRLEQLSDRTLLVLMLLREAEAGRWRISALPLAEMDVILRVGQVPGGC
ncbi:MAG: hypothetical protein EOO40_04560, partial [Deltaproteobacteria bacterium]